MSLPACPTAARGSSAPPEPRRRRVRGRRGTAEPYHAEKWLDKQGGRCGKNPSSDGRSWRSSQASDTKTRLPGGFSQAAGPLRSLEGPGTAQQDASQVARPQGDGRSDCRLGVDLPTCPERNRAVGFGDRVCSANGTRALLPGQAHPVRVSEPRDRTPILRRLESRLLLDSSSSFRTSCILLAREDARVVRFGTQTCLGLSPRSLAVARSPAPSRNSASTASERAQRKRSERAGGGGGNGCERGESETKVRRWVG